MCKTQTTKKTCFTTIEIVALKAGTQQCPSAITGVTVGHFSVLYLYSSTPVYLLKVVYKVAHI